MELTGAQQRASSRFFPKANAATSVAEKASPAPVRSKGGLGSGYGGMNHIRALPPPSAEASYAYAPLGPSVTETILGPKDESPCMSFLTSFSSLPRMRRASSVLQMKTSARR